MQKVMYLKEPGYLSDLYFVFIIYYNQAVITDKYILKTQAATDVQFYKNTLQHFGVFDDDLLPFFYLKQDTFCFMSVKYWRDFDFLDNFNLEAISEKLKDTKAVIENVIDFYFSPDEKSKRRDMQYIGRQIKQSSYPDFLKYRLALFFMDPEYYINKLIISLREKEIILRQYYNDHSDTVFKTQATVDIGGLIAQLSQTPFNRKFSPTYVYYSINLINKNHVSCKDNQNGCFFFLGFDYQVQLAEYIDATIPPDMALWGKVYSERNRIAILKMIKDAGELCSAEVADRINLSQTAVYYHLEMMFDARMLTSRNEGRTIFYSINKEYFERASKELDLFTQDE